jgi:hypothetical protein
LRTGRRLDLVASTGHDTYAALDFRRLREIGMRTAREGLRWHLIEKARGSYDFSSARIILEAAQQEGVQIIWDLLHFGWLDDLDIFSPEFPERFGAFASAFGRLLREETSDVPFVAPVNEISFVSWAGGDVAYLNPFATGRGHELKRQLVRAAVVATEAIKAEVSNVRLVSPEPVIHITGNPMKPNDVRQAAEYTSSMFEAWDMLSGRAHADLGGKPEYLDIIGVNYYDRNQWWNYGKTIRRDEPEYRPCREILGDVHQRYGRPMFISETGAEDQERPGWFGYIAGEVRAAMAAGVELHGLCLYPIVNHPGWDDDRHCHNGLWDYPGPAGEREIYAPLADELSRQKALERDFYGNHTAISITAEGGDAGGSGVSIAPAVELRVSAPAASDEPFRAEQAGVLC